MNNNLAENVGYTMLIKGTQWNKKWFIKKFVEKKEKKKYVAQKQYNWVRKKELFLYFVKGSDHSII